MDRTDPSKRHELFDSAYGQRAIQSWRTLLVSALESIGSWCDSTSRLLLVAIPLHLFADVPIHDDWTYAWSVQHFLKTGKLAVLDWSIHYPFAQILWGALFCLPFGLSFSALRVSTSNAPWLGALALYGTLRELGRARTDGLLAALVLVVNPVFFLLSFSFMTDVPFVSVSNIAFFFIVRAFSEESHRNYG